MQMFRGLLLGGFLVLAAFASDEVEDDFEDGFTCSDIKVFLAPCSLKEAGTIVEKEQALDVESEALRDNGLQAVADKATEYFDFELGAFEGACELPHSTACFLLECHSDCEQLSVPLFNGSRKLALCVPNLGCSQSLPGTFSDGIGLRSAGTGILPAGESILGVCFGDSCKGFMVASKEFFGARRKICGESPVGPLRC